MSILEIIIGVMLIVCGVAVVMLVLAQQSKNDMGSLGGASMYADMSSRSTDAKIAKVTSYAGTALVVLCVVLSAVSIFAK